MTKTVTLIIQSTPYSTTDNRAWDGLRCAGAMLAEDMVVRVHLLDIAVTLADADQTVPADKTNLGALLSELLECGLTVSVCGKALDEHAERIGQLYEGVTRGSMKSLAGWVGESDLVLTF